MSKQTMYVCESCRKKSSDPEAEGFWITIDTDCSDNEVRLLILKGRTKFGSPVYREILLGKHFDFCSRKCFVDHIFRFETSEEEAA